jgi:hypothetical protein
VSGYEERWQDAVQETLQRVCSDEGEGVPTGWVLVMETMEADGPRLHRLRGPDTPPEWRWRGLLHEALRDEGWDDSGGGA